MPGHRALGLREELEESMFDRAAQTGNGHADAPEGADGKTPERWEGVRGAEQGRQEDDEASCSTAVREDEEKGVSLGVGGDDTSDADQALTGADSGAGEAATSSTGIPSPETNMANDTFLASSGSQIKPSPGSAPGSPLKKNVKPPPGSADSVELPPLRYEQPLPPSLVAAECRSLTLEWEPAKEAPMDLPEGSEDHRRRPALHYTLEMQLIDAHPRKNLDMQQQLESGTWEQISTGLALSHEVTGLKPGLKYAFRVCCKPIARVGHAVAEAPPPSSTAVFHTTPAPPSAPNPVTLSSKERKALKFKWPVPEETGGFHDLRYTVELYPPPFDGTSPPEYTESFSVVYHGTETSFKVTKLMPGVKYYVRVMAQNDLGSGPYSHVGEFRTEATVPPQPEPPICYAVTPASVYLHWPPALCHGSAITRYHVQKASASEPNEWENVFTDLDTKCEVHYLTAGERYLFRIAAENDVGKSIFSNSMEVLTAAAAPGAPGSVGASEITQTSANLLWHPPSWDGGAPVMQYEVQLFPKSAAALVGGLSPSWVPVFQNNDTRCSVFGLRGGCTYRARVRCYNQAGIGDFSMVAEFTTLPELPEPTGPPMAMSCGQSTLDMAWHPPAFDGGSEIKSYQLEMCTPEDMNWILCYTGREATCQVGQLQPGSEYCFRVSCTNSEGTSPWSTAVTASTCAAPPSPPGPPSVLSISSSTAMLAWLLPEGNGAPVNSFTLEEVKIGDDQTVTFVTLYHGQDFSFEATGLKPFTEYGFRVRAGNAAGQSAWSPVAICRSAPAPPSKPEDLECHLQVGINLREQGCLTPPSPA